jgi:hypothetical protein
MFLPLVYPSRELTRLADMKARSVRYVGARGMSDLVGQSTLGWKILRAWEAQRRYVRMMEVVWDIRDPQERNAEVAKLDALTEQMWFAKGVRLIIEEVEDKKT